MSTIDELRAQKAEIERTYQTVAGLIHSPGKFEGEPVWAVAVYEAWNEGLADLDLAEGDPTLGAPPMGAFIVDADFRAVYGDMLAPNTYAVAVEEFDNGFIYAKELSESGYRLLASGE